MPSQGIRLKTYENQHLNNGAFVQTVIMDQYGRVFEYDAEKCEHYPNGLCGSANH